MGANTGRVTEVLVTNKITANTGTNPGNIANSDMLIINRLNAVVADTGKVSDEGNDQITIYGTTVAAKPKASAPIQVRNIRSITVTPYEATVQQAFTIVGAVAIPAANLVAGAEFSIMLQFKDNNRQIQEQPTREFYHFKAGAVAPTRAQVAQGLADKINGTNNSALTSMRIKQVSATVAGDNLTITGLAVAENGNEINTYQFRYFDLTLKAGFDGLAAGAVTTVVGKPGRGIGLKVADLEQATLGRQFRFSWPIRVTPLKTQVANKYNLVTIEHANRHIGDLQGTYDAPLTTVVAFVLDDASVAADKASANQTSFITKLTSLAVSAGIPITNHAV